DWSQVARGRRRSSRRLPGAGCVPLAGPLLKWPADGPSSLLRGLATSPRTARKRPRHSRKRNTTSPLAPTPTLRLCAQPESWSRREGCGDSLSGTCEAAPRRPRRGCQAEDERRWPVRGPFQERSPKGKPHTPGAGDWIACDLERLVTNCERGRAEPFRERAERASLAGDEAAGGGFELPELLDLDQEDRDDLGVELRRHAALELAAGDLVRQRLSIGAVRRHRVVRVGDGDDAADERDAVAHQPLRVARAVPGLVVAIAAGDDVAHERDRLQDPPPLGRVRAEHGQLLGRQLAGLVQLVVADADLADVVHEADLDHRVDVGLAHLQ